MKINHWHTISNILESHKLLWFVLRVNPIKVTCVCVCVTSAPSGVPTARSNERDPALWPLWSNVWESEGQTKRHRQNLKNTYVCRSENHFQLEDLLSQAELVHSSSRLVFSWFTTMSRSPRRRLSLQLTLPGPLWGHRHNSIIHIICYLHRLFFLLHLE